MERIDGRLIHDVYLDRVVFRESFTGDGSTTAFTLDGTVGNATFKYGAWGVANAKTTLPAHITKTNKKPAYDSLVPLTRNRIAVSSIHATTGVVTLDYAPRSGVDFYVWYWYDLPNHHLLEDYYREDFVASMEEEATAYGVDITVDTTNFAGIFTSADNTVQKAFDTTDDHTHDGRYFTETEITTWRNSVSQTEMGYLDGLTSDLQAQLDARCLESIFGTSIGTGLVLDSTTLKASAVLQKYHAIDPTADVQAVLGAADNAAIRLLLNVEDGSTADQTGVEIVSLLEALAGAAKLSHDSGLSDISVDDHHAQLHAAEHVTGGGDIIANAIAAGNAGLMSGADKTKLDEIEALANVTDFANVQTALAAASGAVAFNSQNLTGAGTIGCGAITTDGIFTVDTDSGNQPFYITRAGALNETLRVHVDDSSVIFESIQDENTGSKGGFRFLLDAGAPSPAFDIEHDGNTIFKALATRRFGVNVPAPLATVHVDQFSTTAAIPVLTLDQGDVSEQCIKFSSDSTDRDINLFTVDVTGTPTLMWDESKDAFSYSKKVVMPSSDIATDFYARVSGAYKKLGPTADSVAMIFLGGSDSAGEGAYVSLKGGDFGGAGLGGGMELVCSAESGTNNTILMYPGGTYAMGLSKAGRVGIKVATASIAAQLHVDQSSTTAAIPVLTLDQADVSEEMIEFVTTIGVGNAIEAVDGKALTTTHFIKVTIPGSLTRYIPVGTIA